MAVRNGEPVYMAFTDQRKEVTVYTPGICTICGALVPNYKVSLLDEDGIVQPVALHNDWHRLHGDIPDSGMDAPHGH